MEQIVVIRTMRTLSSVRTTIAITIALSAAAAASGESLTDAWQKGLTGNMELAAVVADTDTARQTEQAARAERWPSMTAAAGYTRFNATPTLEIVASGLALQAPIFPDRAYASGSVQVRLPLYTGGRIATQIDAAHQAAVGAAESETAMRSSLRLAIAKAYVDVLRSQRQSQTAQSSAMSLLAHVDDVRLMVEREAVARSDLLAARVAAANAEQRRVQAVNAVALAYAEYNRLIGEPVERTADLQAELPVDRQLGERPLERLTEMALQARGELSAQRAQVEALSLQSDSQRALLLPQLSLSGGYNYIENEILDRQGFSSIGIGVAWNVFDGGVVRNRSAALRSASRAARNRLEDLQTRIKLEVHQAWLNVHAARAQIAATREAKSQAEENLRMSRELYGTGLGTNTQVLDAVALQVAAANNHDNAVLDEDLALIALEHSVGQL